MTLEEWFADLRRMAVAIDDQDTLTLLDIAEAARALDAASMTLREALLLAEERSKAKS